MQKHLIKHLIEDCLIIEVYTDVTVLESSASINAWSAPEAYAFYLR